MKKWYRGFDYWTECNMLVLEYHGAPNVAWARRGTTRSACFFRYETILKEGEDYYRVVRALVDEHWTEKGH